MSGRSSRWPGVTAVDDGAAGGVRCEEGEGGTSGDGTTSGVLPVGCRVPGGRPGFLGRACPAEWTGGGLPFAPGVSDDVRTTLGTDGAGVVTADAAVASDRTDAEVAGADGTEAERAGAGIDGARAEGAEDVDSGGGGGSVASSHSQDPTPTPTSKIPAPNAKPIFIHLERVGSAGTAVTMSLVPGGRLPSAGTALAPGVGLPSAGTALALGVGVGSIEGGGPGSVTSTITLSSGMVAEMIVRGGTVAAIKLRLSPAGRASRSKERPAGRGPGSVSAELRVLLAPPGSLSLAAATRRSTCAAG
ncbi:hypothetical protein LZC95_08265 [Pendulispora brunnea]|uniref:Uncharacterized protein n=1 Tax=Pendulispora brunnea TaxID=2905690 RepID=A0ABZ2KFJ0_9BACT